MKDEAYTISEARQTAAAQTDQAAQFLTAVMTLLVAAAYTKHSKEIPEDACECGEKNAAGSRTEW